MIPNDNNEYKPPKRFSFGYWWRETEELFYAGYFAASKPMREYRRQQEAAEDRKYIEERLEWQLYTLAESGSYEEKMQALKYFQRKKEFEQQQDQRPYTWGEQIMSLATAGLSLALITTLSTVTANWSCGSSQSRFCSNIRANTNGLIQYFANPEPNQQSALPPEKFLPWEDLK